MRPAATSNSFLVDGLDNNDRTSGTSLKAFFSQQVIREFVVLTHQFAPEFGRAAGGILNIVTERGSNETAGSVFIQGTHGDWNDEGTFVGSLPSRGESQSAVGRFQTGFKIGGPLQKDRAFYFAAYEHQESNEIVPYTGVTQNGVAGGWMVAPSHDDNVFLRTDFNLTPRQTLMVRLSGDDRTTNGVNVGGTTTPEAGFLLKEQAFQLAGSLTSVVSDNVLNEARLLVGTSKFDQYANSDLPGVERPSGVFGGNNLNVQLRNEDRFQLVDNLTLRARSHTLKFGGDVTWTHTTIDTQFNPNGNFSYDTDRSFQPGDGYIRGVHKCAFAGDTIVPCPGEPGVDDNHNGLIDEPADTSTYPVVYQYIFGHPQADLHDTQVGLFVQDSWQANARLLLDYGIRYDLSTFHLPADAKVKSTIPNGGAGIDRDNLAPRFGFTYSPVPGGRLLFRGGAGIFYDKIVMGFPAISSITSGTKIALTFPQGFAFEDTEQTIAQYGLQTVLNDVLFLPQLILQFSTGTRLDTPYTTLYNAGVDWSVTERGALRADVVRALGYHQPLFKDLNPPQGTIPPGIPNHVRDPNVGSIAAIVTEGRIWYTGLDLTWRWRGEGAWYQLSYTLSKALDMGPDPLKGGVSLPPDSNKMEAEKGRSDADRRHRFVVAGEIPLKWMGLRASSLLQLSSGAPFNVTTGRDENLDGMTSDRPKGVGRNTGADTPLGPVNALRKEAGLPPVHSLTEPSLVQWDVRISKPFLMRHARTSSEIYLQVFNLLGRFNGGPIEGRVTSRSFGQPVGQVGPPRTVEIGLKLGL